MWPTLQLLKSINAITDYWLTSTFSGSYADAKNQSTHLTEYKNSSKREWVAEKRELDTLLGNLQIKLKTYNLAPYAPPPGLSFEV